ncbi:MAG: hypothetical protein WCT19_03515 [Candidatus Paceibacterota bacterium]|jgi:hypothetical protein
MSNNKGFVGVAAIIIIALIVLGGGYYFAQKTGFFSDNGKSDIVEPVQQDQTAVDTANWETYTNSQYGFEFQYPADFYVVSEHQYAVSGQKDLESGSTFVFTMALDNIKFKTADRFRRFTTVVVYKEPSLEKYLTDISVSTNGSKLFTVTKKEKVSDYPILYKIYGQSFDFSGPGDFQGLAVKDNTYVQIESGSGPTVDQILSTFKFTPLEAESSAVLKQ